jgi:hypothetical protein
MSQSSGYSGERFELRQRTHSRRFVVGGVSWSAYEDPDPEPPKCGPALVFESDHVVRRVRSYPEDWRDLPDEELYTLSWST